MRAISDPKLKKLDADYFLDEFRSAMSGQVKNEIIHDFEQTVRGWHKPPNFGYALTTGGGQYSVIVFPIGPYAQKYAWVNTGTPPRLIRPTKRRSLAFKTGFRASTAPGQLASRRYQRFGSTLYRKAVRWPGIKAREFDATIAKKYKGDFQRTMQNAVTRAARRMS